jgi:hypothetical protein
LENLEYEERRCDSRLKEEDLKLLEIEVILRFLKYIETLLPLSYFANILLPNILLNAYKLPMN